VALQKLAGVWKNKDKNGKVHLSGKFNYHYQILIMKNDYKGEEDRGPDYWVYLSPLQNKPTKIDPVTNTLGDSYGEEIAPF